MRDGRRNRLGLQTGTEGTVRGTSDEWRGYNDYR